jgi:predicted P-loop ATPase
VSKFDDDESPPAPAIARPQDLWQQWGLMVTEKGAPHNNLVNAARIIESDPKYKGGVYYDEFLQRVMRKNSPVREWRDADDLEITQHIQYVIGMPRMGRDHVSQAVISVAHKNPRNCVREWMESLAWDQTPRIDSFFSDHFHARNDEYTRSASKNFWLSMIARVYRPGCKVDNMIVLEGAQGAGKSTAMNIIGGDWFAEQHESATNPKAFAEILQGKLLVEISEMDAFNKAEVNRVKQTVSCSSDRFRASYGRHAADHPRTCVFVGTTNRDDWNRDETGARRFWPIACEGQINIEAIRENRDQYFAEAVTRYKANETHWEMPMEAARQEQEARYQLDPWTEEIRLKLIGKAETTTMQVLKDLGIELTRVGRAEQTRVGTILRVLGWRKGRNRSGDKREYVYHAPEVGTVGTGRDTQSLFKSY